MKFDTVIIGGGLSGLVCGIRLSQKGKRCVIISSGQSALHFSSGSFDLLNTLPSGEEVVNPLSSVNELIKLNPLHPYAKLGADNFTKLSKAAEEFLTEIGVPVKGSVEQNHYRITPMGGLKPTWLSIRDFATSNQVNQLPWKKVAIFNVIGYLDFYPQFLVEEFTKIGCEASVHLFNLKALDHLRRNPSELRAANIARTLDKEENQKELVAVLKKSNDCDTIILPAFVGLDDASLLDKLSKAVGKPILLIPTLPPSAVGIRTQQYLHDYFVRHGGVYMLGDNVNQAELTDQKVSKVYSYNHGNIPFQAQDFVLATGSYFSQGLIADSDRIYEPIFDLDVKYSADRQQWYNTDMFQAQNYQGYGVEFDERFNAIRKGQTLDNLYVVGAVLGGYNPIKEGSGAGVSILSALHVADQILSKK